MNEKEVESIVNAQFEKESKGTGLDADPVLYNACKNIYAAGVRLGTEMFSEMIKKEIRTAIEDLKASPQPLSKERDTL